MKKTIALLCTALMLLGMGLLTGCRREAAKGTIYYLNFKPESAEIYADIAKAYEKETGIKVKVSTAASGEYEQTLKSEMAKSDAPVLFQINGPKGYAAWKDYCADLSETELYKHLTDKDLAIKSDGKVYGIPYVVEGYGIIYNAEILNRYFALKNRQSDVDSVEEIVNFATLKSVVEDMTRRKKELGIDGVFAATSLKSGEDWRWQTHLANVAISEEFDDNDVDLSTDAANTITFKYQQEYKNIFDLYLNHSTTDKKLLGSKQVADSMAEFALGKCAMVQNGNWAWGQIKIVSGNKVDAKNVKFLPIYTGIDGEEKQGLCIGTENFICINKNATAEQQKMAADFMYWLYASETGKRFVTDELGFIAPFDTFDESEQPDDPLALELLNWMEKDDIHTIPWDFTVFPGQAFKDDFGAVLLQYAQGTKTWDDVRTTVVDRWKAEASPK